MIPSNGASMADAARTRENEGPCICDGCQIPIIDCIGDPAGCEAEAREEAADNAIKARKEDRL